MRPSRSLQRRVLPLAIGFTAIGTASVVHLLGLLLAGLRRSTKQQTAQAGDLMLVVVIPAHNEEQHIGRALQALHRSEYEADKLRIVVVADNCTDETARVASAFGARVLERTDPDRRGKGFALAWAFQRILRDPEVQAICVIDADCEVSPHLLRALSIGLSDGAQAVQSAYVISDPRSSTGAALRWAGFALFNIVRPRGRDHLGLSSGLLGTGMAFSRTLLECSPWAAFSYAEDREQHMRWVRDGARVGFVGGAQVRSASAPEAGRRSQEARWESGRVSLARTLSVDLLRKGLADRDLSALDAALEPMLPPQSLLALINVTAMVSARFSGSRSVLRVAVLAVLGQAGYVVLGLASVGAPLPVWQALFRSPAFIARRTGMVAGLVAGHGPTGWLRTAR